VQRIVNKALTLVFLKRSYMAKGKWLPWLGAQKHKGDKMPKSARSRNPTR
jgi:hypothetical protein